MMRRKKGKRLLAVLLILCMTIALGACGSKKEEKTKKSAGESKVKVEKKEKESGEDDGEETLSPEEGTPFTTDTVHEAVAGPVTIHSEWIPFEEPYIMDDLFSAQVAVSKDTVWIMADEKIREYKLAGNAITFVKEIEIEKDYDSITADENGNLYVSAKVVKPLLRIKDGNIEEMGDAPGLVKMQKNGNIGVSAWKDMKKIIISGNNLEEQEWISPGFNGMTNGMISENYVYAAGTDAELDCYVVNIYDMEGTKKLAIGEELRHTGDAIGWITQMLEVPEGFFGMDGNMRKVFLWGADGSLLGAVKAPDLFGTDYPWLSDAVKLDDGSILLVLSQEREDNSAVELLLYRLNGF